MKFIFDMARGLGRTIVAIIGLALLAGVLVVLGLVGFIPVLVVIGLVFLLMLGVAFVAVVLSMLGLGAGMVGGVLAFLASLLGVGRAELRTRGPANHPTRRPMKDVTPKE